MQTLGRPLWAELRMGFAQGAECDCCVQGLPVEWRSQRWLTVQSRATALQQKQPPPLGGRLLYHSPPSILTSMSRPGLAQALRKFAASEAKQSLLMQPSFLSATPCWQMICKCTLAISCSAIAQRGQMFYSPSSAYAHGLAAVLKK